MHEDPLELVGRERELKLVAGFLDSVRVSGSALVLRGEPGIGKTSLWRAGIRLAHKAGTATLTCRCFEAELQLPFTALLDLTEPVGEDIRLLAGPQQAALEAALGRVPAGPVAPDRLAVARAVLELIRRRAAVGPMVIAVDDIQWLDPASARVLSYVARRLERLPVGLLLTERAALVALEGAGPSPLGRAARTETIELGPLSLGALGELLRGRTDAPLAATGLRRLHAAAAGNPFYALEFSRAGVAEPALSAGLRAVADEPLGGLSPETTALLELIAVAGVASTATLASASASASSNAEGMAASLELAHDQGVVRLEGDMVSFSHPLLASAVYQGLSPSRRRALHLRLADVAEGANRARHLALATIVADRQIADVLAREAAAMARRGAPDEAAGLALHAQRLTPAEDDDERHRRGLQAVRFLLHAGEVASAIDTLGPLLRDDTAVGDLRAETLLVRADAEWEDRALLVKLLVEAATIAEDAGTRSRAHLRLAWQRVVDGDLSAASRDASRARRAAGDAGSPFLVEATQVMNAHIATMRGQSPELDLEEVSADDEPMPPWHRTRRLAIGCHRLWAGDLVGARRLLLDERDELTAVGRLLRVPFVLLWLAELEWRSGDWPLAERYAAEGSSMLADAGRNGKMIMAYLQALIAASRGDAETARALTKAGLKRADAQNDALAIFRNRWIVAELELSLNDPAAAWRELDGLAERLGRGGFRQPGMFPILSTSVEAAASLGLVEEAEMLYTVLAADAAAAGGAWGGAAAAHAHAHVHLARGDHEAAIVASERAAETFGQIGFPFDESRALLTLGRAAHGAGQRRRAREALDDAGEHFARLGARAWTDRANAEARRISGRRGSRDQLTEAERGVAALVGQGLSNKEVATRLFTSVATVESHLTRIYRKCGVRSRTELMKRLAEGGIEASRP